MAKHSSQILELARRGASMRLRELRDEIKALMAQFPHLNGEIGGSYPVPEESVKRRGRRRGRMSAAARKATSLRMKKYWAARRAAAK